MRTSLGQALDILEDGPNIEELFAKSGLLFHDTSISREEALKRNSEIVECDRCGVTGNRPNMMRWHFDNCKVVLRKCLQCECDIPRQGIKDCIYNKKLYCNRQCYMASKKGKPPIEMTTVVREKIRVLQTGRIHTPEARRNMSLSRLGKPRGPYKKRHT